MKTITNIPVNSNGNDPLDLLMEVGDWGVSCLWFSIKPLKIRGVNVFVFDDNDDKNDAIGSIVNNILPNKNKLRQLHLFYNYKDSIIIPTAYNLDDQNKYALELLFGHKQNSSVITENTILPDLLNTYRYSDSIHSLLNNHFTIATQRHTHSLQLSSDSDETGLYCIVFYDAIKIILYKNGKLQHIQQYQYANPDDVLYHLLNTCMQYDLVPGETSIKLSGMIVEDSLLFKHLYHHFSKIQFAESAAELSGNDELNKLPLHFFKHLTDLASCV